MIPKTIHYVWLSDELMDENALKCIASWKRFAPDFTVRRWSMKDFDFSRMPAYVNEAIAKKKWAFATDYLRLYILYHEGGLYLDSDVLMVKRPHRYLRHRFVSAVEYYEHLFRNGRNALDEEGKPIRMLVEGMAIQAAILGAEPKHPLIARVMEYYEKEHFVMPDGSLNTTILAPHILAWYAKDFGFCYENRQQQLAGDAFLWQSEVFAPDMHHARCFSVMVHLCSGSWRDASTQYRKRYRQSITVQIAYKQNRRKKDILKSIIVRMIGKT